ncbi:MAG: Re/Si-specific NAD(P)(+) transhydrogenase subunit alpha [Gammaproteobacteria bacterium]|nr:Re/Si-specific NAD(P)(+) transhydrogenase subunit alpha [Gammaproteobacteria bacterium]
MRVCVLRESRAGERRVALVPAEVAALAKVGVEVAVESGAGEEASFLDNAFREAGASVCESAAQALEGSDVVVKINPPSTGANGSLDEVAALPEGIVLISFVSPVANLELVRRLADARVTTLAMDQVPRITRAQKMDALSSQATVAGYRASLLAATHLGKFLPMFMTAAGTIPPGKVLILGAGVAGLQAIATARRLGAVVEAFDIRPAVKEQVQSLGAKFLEAELDESAEDEGGYARALSEEKHQQELELIGGRLPDMDAVITTANIPGARAPVLITSAMVATMRPGSVIIDLAGESGGNCELSEHGKVVVHDGVIIAAPDNLPSELPTHASQMYARNVTSFLQDIVEDGELKLDFDDEVVSGSCVTHDGEVVHARTLERMSS